MSIRLDDAIVRKLEVTNEGKFVYSGIQEASTNSARPVWFSNNSGPSVPVYSDTFKYNPSTRSLELTPAANDANAYLKTTTGILNIKSASTLYLDRGSDCSLIFQLAGTENARFDTSGNFRPKGENLYSIGNSTYPWKDIYARRILASAEGQTYAYLNASTLGTTSELGTARLSLGNGIAKGTAKNARGQMLFYGQSTGYLIIYTNVETGTPTLYLRDHGKTAYTVGTPNTSAVGGNTHPVYVDSSGIVTACGSLWTNSDLNSTSEFQVGAISAAGKIYLYSQETSTKNRGIYGFNNAGEAISILTVTKDNVVSLNGSSTKLATGRTLKVALNSTNASTAFNGEANVHDIGVSGTLAPGNGGTGQTTLKNAANSLINALDTGSSTPVDADYYISQYVGGGTTTTTYHRRPMSALWSYISGKSDARYVNLSGDTMTGSLTISHAANATMNHTTTNPRIVFSESGTQPVGLVYTDYDTYRAPAGLKVLDMSGSNGNVWFEVQGAIYAGGNIYTIHPTGGETNINVAHGTNEYLMLWGNNSSGSRGLWDTTKGSVITVTDTASTFHGNASTATELKAPITFTPAETALTPANVKSLIGTGSQIRKGSWSYAGNGYIANGSTATSQCPFGAIDLAGTTVIQSTTGTEYTQIYITPPTANTSGAIKGEMIYYIDQGSGYSPTWYRVLTNNNYTSYTVKKDGTGATGTWGINISGNAATASSVAWGNVTGKPSSYTPASHSHDYLPLTGGTITGKLQVNGLMFGYNYGTGGNNCAAFIWDKPGSNYTGVGACAENDTIYFGACDANGAWVASYRQKWKFNGSLVVGGGDDNCNIVPWTNNYSTIGTESLKWWKIYATNIYGDKVYGAVWNDYAEYRGQFENIPAGRVAYCKNDGKLRITTERLQRFEGVVSDTFGFAIGETDNAKTPLAVSGRVLVYTYEPRDTFNSGDCVCAAPNGTVSKMTREEIVTYPDRIVGIVSEIPEYETWGTGEVPVNGRIWIKVK